MSQYRNDYNDRAKQNTKKNTKSREQDFDNKPKRDRAEEHNHLYGEKDRSISKEKNVTPKHLPDEKNYLYDNNSSNIIDTLISKTYDTFLEALIYLQDPTNTKIKCNDLKTINSYGTNALGTICSLYPERVKLFLPVVKQLFTVAKDTEGLKNLFSHRNAKELNILNFVIIANNLDLIELILENAKYIFANDLKGHKEFFYNKNNKGHNLLKNIFIGGNEEIIKIIFKNIKEIYEDEPSEYKNFLSSRNQDNLNILNICIRTSNTQIIKLILYYASEIYKKDPRAYKEFFTNQDMYGLNILIAAVKDDNLEIIDLILRSAKEIFKDDTDKKEYIKFFTHKDLSKFNVLNSAVKAGNLDVIKLIFNYAADIFKDKHDEYKNFFTNKCYTNSNVLNTAVRIGNKEIIKLILNKAAEIFKKNEYKEHKNFFINQNAQGFNILNSSAQQLLTRDIIEYIIKKAFNLFVNDRIGLEDFFTCKNQNSYTALANAATSIMDNIQEDSFILLLDKGKEIFSYDPKKWQNYLTQINTKKNSILHILAKSGKTYQLELYLKHLQEAYAGDDLQYVAFFAYKNKYDETAISEAELDFRHEKHLLDEIKRIIITALEKGPLQKSKSLQVSDPSNPQVKLTAGIEEGELVDDPNVGIPNLAISSLSKQSKMDIEDGEFISDQILKPKTSTNLAIQPCPKQVLLDVKLDKIMNVQNLTIMTAKTTGMESESDKTTIIKNTVIKPLTLFEKILNPATQANSLLKETTTITFKDIEWLEFNKIITTSEEYFIFIIPTVGRDKAEEILAMLVKSLNGKPGTIIIGLNAHDTAENIQRLKIYADKFKQAIKNHSNIHIIFKGFLWDINHVNSQAKIVVPFGSIRNKLLQEAQQIIKNNVIPAPIVCFMDDDIRNVTHELLYKIREDNNLQIGAVGSHYNPIENDVRSNLEYLGSILDMQIKSAITKYGYLIEHFIFFKGLALKAMLEFNGDGPFNLGAAEMRGVTRFAEALGLSYGFLDVGSAIPKNIGRAKATIRESEASIQIKDLSLEQVVNELLVPYTSAQLLNFSNQFAYVLGLWHQSKLITQLAKIVYLPNLLRNGLNTAEKALTYVNFVFSILLNQPSENTMLLTDKPSFEEMQQALINLQVKLQEEFNDTAELIIKICKKWSITFISSAFNLLKDCKLLPTQEHNKIAELLARATKTPITIKNWQKLIHTLSILDEHKQNVSDYDESDNHEKSFRKPCYFYRNRELTSREIAHHNQLHAKPLNPKLNSVGSYIPEAKKEFSKKINDFETRLSVETKIVSAETAVSIFDSKMEDFSIIEKSPKKRLLMDLNEPDLNTTETLTKKIKILIDDNNPYGFSLKQKNKITAINNNFLKTTIVDRREHTRHLDKAKRIKESLIVVNTNINETDSAIILNKLQRMKSQFNAFFPIDSNGLIIFRKKGSLRLALWIDSKFQLSEKNASVRIFKPSKKQQNLLANLPAVRGAVDAEIVKLTKTQSTELKHSLIENGSLCRKIQVRSSKVKVQKRISGLLKLPNKKISTDIIQKSQLSKKPDLLFQTAYKTTTDVNLKPGLSRNSNLLFQPKNQVKRSSQPKEQEIITDLEDDNWKYDIKIKKKFD